MKPRISVLTLGVADLEQAHAFHRDGLGLPTAGIVGREFEARRGRVSHLPDREPPARSDAHVSAHP